MDFLVLMTPVAALWAALALTRPCAPAVRPQAQASDRMRELRRRTLDAYDRSWSCALASRHDTGLALVPIAWQVLLFQLSYGRFWLLLHLRGRQEPAGASLDPLIAAADRVLSRTLALHLRLDTA